MKDKYQPSKEVQAWCDDVYQTLGTPYRETAEVQWQVRQINAKHLMVRDLDYQAREVAEWTIRNLLS